MEESVFIYYKVGFKGETFTFFSEKEALNYAVKCAEETPLETKDEWKVDVTKLSLIKECIASFSKATLEESKTKGKEGKEK